MWSTRAALLLVAIFVVAPAGATTLVPSPGEAGSDDALHALAARYDRQFHTFSAARFGVSLDLHINDPQARALVDGFFGQTTHTTFLDYTASIGDPTSVDDIVDMLDEHGDLGMFGGVAAGADAFRYVVLKRDGASAPAIEEARSDLLDAIHAFHVYATITGFPGGLARGVGLADDVADASVPLPANCPNSWERSGRWRDDASGLWPGWRWIDEVSKDQLIGYIFALGAFWDAVADDDAIDDSVRAGLRADATALGHALMTEVDVGASEPIDLVLRDAGGCVVRFFDLNPRAIPRSDGPPLLTSDDTANPNAFSALVALSTIRTLYHVSGDEDLRAYYYDELVGVRDYPGMLTRGLARLKAMFLNFCLLNECAVTNFSNVNMAYTASYGLLRYETDPALNATYRAVMEGELWDNERPHVGKKIQQAYFNLLHAGFGPNGTDDVAADNASAQLAAFHDIPYWQTELENCDAGEIAAGTCLASDGTTTLTIDDVPGRSGDAVATAPLPLTIRPGSNFEWRSDPRSLNSGPSARLNPGGDFRAAYWLGRLLVRALDADANTSPIARTESGGGGPTSELTADAGVSDAGTVVTDSGAPGDGGGSDAGGDDAGPPTLDEEAGPGSDDAGPVADDAGDPGATPAGCACGATGKGALAGWGAWVGMLALARGGRRRSR